MRGPMQTLSDKVKQLTEVHSSKELFNVQFS